MIDLDLPTEQAQLDQVLQTLLRTARSRGLDVAGDLLEALQGTIASPPGPGPAGRR